MESIRANKRILVLDKGSRLLNAVDELLTSGDWELVVTFDAEGIYNVAKTYQPDLIVLDYLLLNEDCALVCQDLQEDEELRKVPIIIVTAYKSRKIIAEAYKCDALFVKPLDLELLVSRVNCLMAS